MYKRGYENKGRKNYNWQRILRFIIGVEIDSKQHTHRMRLKIEKNEFLISFDQ